MVTWERVAEIARELPETEETLSWGKPSFKILQHIDEDRCVSG